MYVTNPSHPSFDGTIKHLILSEKKIKAPQKIRKNNPITTLASVGKEYMVSFEMMVTKHDASKKWGGVIYLYNGADSSYPGVWLHKDLKLQWWSLVNGKFIHIYTHNEQVKEGKWYHIAIMQVYEDGKVPTSFITKVQMFLFSSMFPSLNSTEKKFIKRSTKNLNPSKMLRCMLLILRIHLWMAVSGTSSFLNKEHEENVIAGFE